MHISARPARLDVVPALGQDTEAILQELGYTATEIAKMRNDGAIRTIFAVLADLG